MQQPRGRPTALKRAHTTHNTHCRQPQRLDPAYQEGTEPRGLLCLRPEPGILLKPQDQPGRKHHRTSTTNTTYDVFRHARSSFRGFGFIFGEWARSPAISRPNGRTDGRSRSRAARLEYVRTTYRRRRSFEAAIIARTLASSPASVLFVQRPVLGLASSPPPGASAWPARALTASSITQYANYKIMDRICVVAMLGVSPSRGVRTDGDHSAWETPPIKKHSSTVTVHRLIDAAATEPRPSAIVATVTAASVISTLE
jgi:hypothetical protein